MKKKYSKSWGETANRIKEKARWKCENCFKKHNPEEGYCLTTHHIDGKTENDDDRMLVALCQRCHLAWEWVCIIGQLWLFKKPKWIEERGL